MHIARQQKEYSADESAVKADKKADSDGFLLLQNTKQTVKKTG